MQLLRDIVEIFRSARGDEDPDTLTAIRNVELIWQNSNAEDAFDNDFEDAERYLSDLADIQRRLLGLNNADTWGTVWVLSDVYWRHGKSEQAQGRSQEAQRKYEKAEQLTHQVLDFYGTLPPGITGLRGGSISGVHMDRLAGILASQGKYAEAEEEYKTNLGWRRRAPGESDVQAFIVLDTRALGWVQLHEQKYADAETKLREACGWLAISKNGWSESQPRYACESELGASLVGQKKYADAEPLLSSGYDGLVRTQEKLENWYDSRTMPRLSPAEAAGWIARMYEEWGKPQQAAEWRQKAEAKK